MLERLIRRLYDACGAWYRLVPVAAETGSSVLVTLVTVGLVSTYYDPPLGRVLVVMAVGGGLAASSVLVAAVRSRAAFARISHWQATAVPTPRETVAAWEIASTITLRQYRRATIQVSLLTIVPTCLVARGVWHIGWSGVGAMLLASLIPAVYTTVVSYSVGEMLSRPLIEDIAVQLPDEFRFTPRGLPVATRLRISLPAYTTCSGIAVGALVGGGDGSGDLVVAVLVAMAVGLLLSLELTSLLTSSLTRPIADVRDQLARVRAGDYAARATVLSSDELGELAHDFNRMAAGLAEREELRDAFGTYVDKDVVELILSGQVPQEGVEVEVSVLFCDVRSFTTYAEQAEASEVVATLNTLFSEIVPVIEAYGGHVDKFLGDGLLAVFGTPEPYDDHADRAVDAARMLVDVVDQGASGLRMGAGVNSGFVVAGPLGGAGRLNFSVVGDVVNVAARVEAATRETGDDVLVTAATRARLRRPQALVARGPLELKGKRAPTELFALVPGPSSDQVSATPGRADAG